MADVDSRRSFGDRLNLSFLALIVAVTALLALAPSASATNFAVLLGGSQAGSDQDQAWLATANATGRLSSLDYRLSGGYWPHMHRASGRCSDAAAAANACPADSRIGGVSAVFTTSFLPVFYTGFIALNDKEASGASRYSASVVLNPLSSYYRRVVLPASIDVVGQDGAPVVRVRVTDLPSTLPRSNGSQQAVRLRTFSIDGRTTNGRKRWLRNPTTCANPGSIRLDARYADGRVDSVARSTTATGCSSLVMRTEVMFNPREYTLRKSTGFTTSVTAPDPLPGEVHSDLRNVAIDVPEADLDLSSLVGMPACEDASDLFSGNCPAGSRLGDVCATSGPERTRMCGDIWLTSPISQSTQTATVSASACAGAVGGSCTSFVQVATGVLRRERPDGGFRLELRDVTQLDLRELMLRIENPLLRNSNRCFAAAVYTSEEGWSGFSKSGSSTVPTECPPLIELTDPGDIDADGDGFADDRYRPAFFDVFFDLADQGDGIDPASVRCTVRGWDPKGKGPITGSARVVDLDGDGLPDVCQVAADEEGDTEVEISAADHRGHVTVLKLAVTVDNTPPSISIDEPGVHITGDPDFDLIAVVTDGNLTTVTCELQGSGSDANAGCGDMACASDPNAACGDSICSTDPDIGCGDSVCSLTKDGGDNENWNFRCRAEGLTEGLHRFVLTATDKAGNASSSFFDVFVDFTAPVVETTDPKDDDCDGVTDQCFRPAFFDVFFTASDASFPLSSEPPQAECVARSNRRDIRGTVAWRSIPENSVWEGACQLEGLDDGLQEVEVKVSDGAGHVTVLKRSYTVDTVGPSIAVNEEGTHNFAASFFDVFVGVDEPNLALVRCGVATGAGAAAGAARCGGNGDEDCDGIGDLDGDGLAEFRCHVSDASEGPQRIEFTATDRAGNTASAFFDVFVDLTAPAVTTLDPADMDLDGDGYADGRFRPAFFDITYRVDESGSGIDPATPVCVVITNQGRDRLRVTPSSQTTGRYTCSLANLPEGDVEVEFAVADAAGHVTVPKSMFTVDTTGPVVETFSAPGEPDDCDDAADACWRPAFFDVFFEAQDGAGTDNANFRATGSFSDGSTRDLTISDLDRDGRPDVVAVDNAPEGPVVLRLYARDSLGNESETTRVFVVDATPPSIAIDEPGVHITGDPDFDLFAVITDGNLATVTCQLQGSGSDANAGCGDRLCSTDPDAPCGDSICSTDPDIACGDSICSLTKDNGDNENWNFRCSTEGLTEGLHRFVLTTTDKAGNTSTSFFDVFVDLTSPTLTTVLRPDVDLDGDGYAENRFRPAFFDITYRMDDFGSGVDAASVSCVTITNEGRDRIRVTPTSQTTGRFTCPQTNLPEGDVEVEAAVADAAGHVTVLKSKFTVDTTGPVIAFDPGDDDSDGDGYADNRLRGHDVLLIFDQNDSLSGIDPTITACRAFLEQGGIVVILDGTFESGERSSCRFVDLPDGDVELEVTTADRVGNTTQRRTKITVDATPPSIAIDEPGVHITGDPDFDLFTALSLSIDGSSDPTTWDPYRCAFNLEGDFDSISRPTSNCAPGNPIQLQPGLNRVGLKVADAAGNMSVAFFDVFLDTAPPTISTVDPLDQDDDGDGWAERRFRSSFFDITYRVEDDSFALPDGRGYGSGTCTTTTRQTPKTDFGTLVRNADDTYTCQFGELADGDYDVAFSFVDGGGHVTVLKAAVTVDTTNPEVQIIAPTSSYLQSLPPIEYRFIDRNPHRTHFELRSVTDGRVVQSGDCDDDDLSSGPCRWASDPYSEDATRLINWSLTTIPPGSYRVEVYAIDRFGNSGATSIDFVIDNEAPSVSFSRYDGQPIDPTQGLTVPADDPAAHSLEFELSEPADVACTATSVGADGAPLGPPEPRDCANLSIQVGPNAGSDTATKQWCFKVTATDQAQNAGSRDICIGVTRTNTQPTLSIATLDGQPIDAAAPLQTSNPDPVVGFTVDGPANVECEVFEVDASGSQVGAPQPRDCSGLTVRVGPNAASEGETRTWCVAIRATDSDGDVGQAQVCLTVSVPDVTPPTVTWTSPTPGAVLPFNEILGQLAISDNVSSTGRVTIRNAVTMDTIANEEVWNHPAYGFTAAVADGPVRLQAEVKDEAGNTTVAPIEFTVDTALPTISTVDPLDRDGDGWADERFRPAFFDITYLIEEGGSGVDADATTCVARGKGGVRGGSMTVHSQTSSTRIVTCAFAGLDDGDYELELSVADLAGHVTVLKRNVTVVATAPVVEFVDPVSGDVVACDGDPVTGQASIPITYAVRVGAPWIPGGAIVSAAVNGGPSQRLSFDPSLSVQVDELNIDCREMTTGLDVEYRIVAIDAAGNTGEAVGTLRFDTEAPTISFAGTPSVFSSSRPSIPFTVTDDNPGTTSCYVLPEVGDEVLVAFEDCGGAWSDGSCDCGLTPDVDLPDASYRLHVVHRDLAARVTSGVHHFQVDTTIDNNEPPIVDLILPVPGGHTSSHTPQIDFAVTSTNPGTTECRITGMGIDRSWACAPWQTIPVYLPLGTYRLAVTHTDANGLSASDTHTFSVVQPDPQQVCAAVYPPPAACITSN